jgi:hypothetical protein
MRGDGIGLGAAAVEVDSNGTIIAEDFCPKADSF